MSKQYCRVIGILGAPNAGKTASLVSLYLLLAHNKLEGFEFRDSRSIMAFEEISRGARRWNEGSSPEQMTIRTEIGEARTAGFMHLRLLDTTVDEPVDFLIPDLPGEWSDSLIDSNRHDRLGFLKSAESIWLMVDGQTLIESGTRQHTLHRTRLLMQRIASFLEARIPPITLVISRHDFGTPSDATIKNLKDEAARHGITMTIVYIASFSDGGKVAAGTGIADLISSTVIAQSNKPLSFWPDSQVDTDTRAMLGFRNRGEL